VLYQCTSKMLLTAIDAALMELMVLSRKLKFFILAGGLRQEGREPEECLGPSRRGE
jgi:hypothetical protein